MENEVQDTDQESIYQESQTSEQQAVDLNLNDLAAIRSVLDVASQRGAFKANELEAVGKIYNKLNNFLESVAKKEQ
jgi:hypothetical protein